ncbi:hypothetical protein [Marinimicrobium agarilyticum]|uniref:hypothetical protein n=1 Tax=Marinimicrobium agarilyticum TaxID=306546 RepID=UPI000481C333|nr:hypothetical protein [Marinimicrobium agarilyticum]
MKQEPQGSVVAQIFCLALFGGSAIAALIVFIAEVVAIVRGVTDLGSTVSINKGFLYLFGLGILSAMMTYALVFFAMLKRPVTGKLKTVTNIGFTVGFASLIVLPQAIHFPANHFLLEKGYEICQPRSYTWFFYKRLVYVDSEAECLSVRYNGK